MISGNQTGVSIGNTSNIFVQGNFIGLNAAGTAALGNGNGVIIGGGSATTNNTIGGTVAGARNVISGNIVGISITGSTTTGNKVQGNYIGTNPAGTAAIGNVAQGVLVQTAASNNTIGGAVAGAGNVISGNDTGVQFANGATGNFVQGNLIGLNAAGTAALGNTGQGVVIGQGATITTVGGATPGARNVISGNVHGVAISGAGTSISMIQGNYIGTDITGGVAIGNADRGVWVHTDAANTNIGGAGPGEGNVIAANPGGNIWLDGAGVGNSVIQGNLIGVNAAGTAGFGASQQFGINIPAASNTIIGGTIPSARNVISGTQKGIQLLGTTNTIIQGNYLGTSSDGSSAIANSGYGVFIEGASATTIGGSTAAEGNVISGNSTAVYILAASGETAINNIVMTNLIGTRPDGVMPLGNGTGLILQADPGGTLTGSTTGYNTIAFNGSPGVTIMGAGATNNQLISNSIFGNTGIGIDLGNDGVTANDFLVTWDSDDGPNHLQNFPFSITPTTTTVAGEIFTAPVQNFTIQFFSSDTPNSEGKTLIATSVVTTNMPGHAFIGPLPVTLVSGQWVTATATDANGNTSEFSAAWEVSPDPPVSAGLVSWWRAEGNAHDARGTNHGTLENGATFAPGKVGQAFSFDGMDDAVVIGDPPNLRLQNFTIDAWVKRASTTIAGNGAINEGLIVAHKAGGYGLGLFADGRLFSTKVGVNNVDSGALQVTDTNWHHVAVTKTGDTVRFYLDGVAVVAPAYDPGFLFGNLAIGRLGLPPQ